MPRTSVGAMKALVGTGDGRLMPNSLRSLSTQSVSDVRTSPYGLQKRRTIRATRVAVGYVGLHCARHTPHSPLYN